MRKGVQFNLDLSQTSPGNDIANALYFDHARSFKPMLESEDYLTGDVDDQKAVEALHKEGVVLEYFHRYRRGFVLFAKSSKAGVVLAQNRYTVCSQDTALTDKLADLCASFFVERPAEEGHVHVTFAHQERGFPVSQTRTIEAAAWPAVAANYAPQTRARLQSLVQTVQPSNGRLVVFNGPPGTGKTYAARTLLHAWEPWCSFIYVVDPEEFFRSPKYMLSLLPEAESFTDNDAENGKKPFTLFICDDADEYLAADAKNRHGQDTARLLNVLDGFIGQGLNILFLLTTNMGIEKLNEAAIRPGRCLANISFDKFTHQEAEEWLQAKKPNATLPQNNPTRLGIRSDTESQGQYTLAQLYAHLQTPPP